MDKLVESKKISGALVIHYAETKLPSEGRFILKSKNLFFK